MSNATIQRRIPGALVQRLRLAAGLSQRALATRLGVSNGLVWLYERDGLPIKREAAVLKALEAALAESGARLDSALELRELAKVPDDAA